VLAHLETPQYPKVYGGSVAKHSCGCVECTEPFPFAEGRTEGTHEAIRFGAPSRHFEVWLDGERTDHCFEADTSAGMVAVFTRNGAGKHHLAPCGHVCSAVQRGSVELRQITPAPIAHRLPLTYRVPPSNDLSRDAFPYDFAADQCWRCDATESETNVGLCTPCHQALTA
jgi:hypothetical protein